MDLHPTFRVPFRSYAVISCRLWPMCLHLMRTPAKNRYRRSLHMTHVIQRNILCGTLYSTSSVKSLTSVRNQKPPHSYTRHLPPRLSQCRLRPLFWIQPQRPHIPSLHSRPRTRAQDKPTPHPKTASTTCSPASLSSSHTNPA